MMGRLSVAESSDPQALIAKRSMAAGTMVNCERRVTDSLIGSVNDNPHPTDVSPRGITYGGEMSTDSEYRWAPISHNDVTAWAELTEHLAEVDGTEEIYSAEDRAEELAGEHIDPANDTWGIWHGEQMVGFGTIWVRQTPTRENILGVDLTGGIHAEHRRRGLGTELMHRMEARAHELAPIRHPGVRYFLTANGELEGSPARTFHASRGYQVARHFHFMGRDLSPGETASSIHPRELPAGVSVRAPRQDDADAVFAAHSVAFVDHWGSSPPSPSVWNERWQSRSKRMEASAIAVNDSGEVLAYSLCGQWVDREIYVNLVGTTPDARGQGLASAVLAHTIAACSASGDYDVIELDVDSASPTGATRLYERLGFSVKHTSAVMHSPEFDSPVDASLESQPHG